MHSQRSSGDLENGVRERQLTAEGRARRKGSQQDLSLGEKMRGRDAALGEAGGPGQRQSQRSTGKGISSEETWGPSPHTEESGARGRKRASGVTGGCPACTAGPASSEDAPAPLPAWPLPAPAQWPSTIDQPRFPGKKMKP